MLPSKDPLEQLQKRVREATGPDAELNLAILEALQPDHVQTLLEVNDDNMFDLADLAPNYTTDPEGLGACVALLRSVLPGWARLVDARNPGHAIDVDLFPDKGLPVTGSHRLETHALLLAIISAKLSLSKAKEAV